MKILSTNTAISSGLILKAMSVIKAIEFYSQLTEWCSRGHIYYVTMVKVFFIKFLNTGFKQVLGIYVELKKLYENHRHIII